MASETIADINEESRKQFVRQVLKDRRDAAIRRELADYEATKTALSNVIAEKKQFAKIAAKLKREVSELKLKLNAEKARHTKTYKDEMIRMQYEEIKTLKGELAELRKCLKEAIGCATEFQKFFEEHPYLCKYTRDVVKKSRKALEVTSDDNVT